MLTRLEFLRTSGTALLLPALAQASIDWSFPGVVCAYAQRLSDASPFLQHDERRIVPAASVIKLLILVAAAREIERRGWSWQHELELRASEIVAGSETYGLDRSGERTTLDRLARAMIAQSDNTAANVFVDWLGFAKIDALASQTGLQETRMRRHFMDFDARARGIDNTTSARDMGALALGIASGRHLGFAGVSAPECRRIVGYMLAQEDRETIPAGVARDVKIANKTGELQDVRHDVAIVDLDGANPYVVALLSAGITNRRSAFARLREIAAGVDRMALQGTFRRRRTFNR